MALQINASTNELLNQLVYTICSIGILGYSYTIWSILNLKGTRKLLKIHYFMVGVPIIHIMINLLAIVLVSVKSSIIMWLINLHVWLFNLIALLLGSELIHCFQPLFVSLSDTRMFMLKCLIVAVFLLSNGFRAVKDLLYTSSQQDNFFSIWYMYGSPVFSLVQLILNSSYLIIMFYGIYKISRRKSNRAELEFIKSKYARANVYLVVYVLFVVYFGGVTVLISRIDTADPFIHVFVLKLNVLLLQPFVILGLLYLKLYYLLLEIFAKRQVTNDSKSKSIANATSHTLILAPQ
ncbi:hypothetical protein HDV01_003767 [Terramyces sp. JEL0728]|nr:hypothetical protein HDV01_003767 [Terramyces sp. JEL0728]